MDPEGGNPFWTDEGRAAGIALHRWLRFLIDGRVSVKKPDPRIADKVAGIYKFIRETGFKPVGGEEPLYDPETGVACMPDMWGYIGPWTWVIDMKAGAKLPAHVLQTACQKIVLKANGFNAQKRGSLYLKNMDYRLEEHGNPQDRLRWLWQVSEYKKLIKEMA